MIHSTAQRRPPTTTKTRYQAQLHPAENGRHVRRRHDGKHELHVKIYSQGEGGVFDVTGKFHEHARGAIPSIPLEITFGNGLKARLTSTELGVFTLSLSQPRYECGVFINTAYPAVQSYQS